MSRKLLIKRVEPEDLAQILKCYPDENKGHIRVGEKGYMFPIWIQDGLHKIHNMEIRPTDVFVVTYPRSGTTWCQEMVWLINNDLNFEKAKDIPLPERFPFIEYPYLFTDNLEATLRGLKAAAKTDPNKMQMYTNLHTAAQESLSAALDPRFMKSHLALEILPPDLLETAKVVYVARDPRDVVVSFYHMSIFISHYKKFIGTFRDYWNLFKKNLTTWNPIFEHVKDAWKLRNHPNMLFIFYEEMSKDLPAVIHRVSAFYGKQYNQEQVMELCEHLNFENFAKNKAIQSTANKTSGTYDTKENFVRKGKVGGWKEYFVDDMAKEVEEWMTENLKDTDLRFF